MSKIDDTFGTMTKEQFIEWTTQGYPMKFNEDNTLKDFLILFADFVNQSENDFESFIADSFEKVFVQYDRQLIATITYDVVSSKILILTGFDQDNMDDNRIFNQFELKRLLGDVCLGVIFFCRSMETIQSEFKVKENQKILNEVPKDIDPSKYTSNNIKYKPWPL